MIVCVNGNETPGWQEQKDFLDALKKTGHALFVVDPRGVGVQRPKLSVKGHEYADPLNGVEENLAYNAFLVGKSLVGMRVADVHRVLYTDKRWQRIVLVGRRDAAIVATMTAALHPRVTHLAVEEMPLSYRYFFDPAGRPINAASIVPALLRDFGDIEDVLAKVAPRKMLSAAGFGKLNAPPKSMASNATRFSANPAVFTKWLDQ